MKSRLLPGAHCKCPLYAIQGFSATVQLGVCVTCSVAFLHTVLVLPSDNHLTRLDPGICRLAQLQFLALDSNRLTELPFDINLLQSLTVLVSQSIIGQSVVEFKSWVMLQHSSVLNEFVPGIKSLPSDTFEQHRHVAYI